MPKTLRCDPALFQKDLAGKVYLVTGANSGIGLATTEQLVRQGAHVVMGCRRVEAGRAAAQALAGLRGSVEVLELNLGKLDSVRAAAQAFKGEHERLDGLVNNAGIMAGPFEKTADGFEAQLGTNHFGHFLLTELLLDVIKASAPARIVAVSSCYHVAALGQTGEIDFDDLSFERRPYHPWKAYAQSKLANVLHAEELARRLEGTGVTAYSVHPGWVRSNLISRTMPAWLQNFVIRPLAPLIGLLSPEDGAQTSLHCLLDDDVPKHNGGYFSQTGIYREKKDRKGGWPLCSPNPQVHDADVAKKLYEVSLEAVGLGS